ncbi:hypothetical protein Pelo_17760 [Pelomyxa schiedti]|nr:hypothetical protein Pelo_17760 [Pelomyxa schiedti]
MRRSREVAAVDVTQGIDAKSQFIAFACGAWSPSKSAEGQDPSSLCFVGRLPSAVITDLVGKAWVLRPERNICITFSLRSVSGLEDRIFFSVSHTLGILVGPVPVWTPRPLFGWLGGNNCVVHRVIGHRAPFDSHGFSVVDTSLPKWLQVMASIRNRPCCNKRWIVIISGGRGDSETMIHVWRVVGSLPQGDEKAFICPWIEHPLDVRFYGGNEYTVESDFIEVMYSQKGHKGNHVCILQVDLIKAMAEGGTISNANAIECTNPNLTTFSLCLVQQSPERQYYFPFQIPVPNNPCSQTVQLFHFNTGKFITWMEEASNCCRRVDDSHLAITSNDKTAIFNPFCSSPSEPNARTGIHVLTFRHTKRAIVTITINTVPFTCYTE